ncbi:SRPBCC family protein [Glaciecola sp. MF2-115]|uniref:SRPBCC family protein n=1 Tax=Glaciecola sp. MF2-115 TaxID=3384827 RepID=UPI00399FE218|mmetsp:Transcript_40230/g.128447  ORF Transcript_40230/g.128447 Transcript_40230/m.128447 type:complete len:151 (+) Transcript_40230:80-532(+)
MFSISVERTIDKPIAEVFKILSDHANYSQFKGIDKSSLIKQGATDINGVGAVREIKAAGATLHEEIVAYEPPFLLGYKIIHAKPLPYDHKLGEVKLSEVEGKTHVHWRSQGHIPIPVLGDLYFDKQIQKGGQRAFGSILKFIDNMPNDEA